MYIPVSRPCHCCLVRAKYDTFTRCLKWTVCNKENVSSYMQDQQQELKMQKKHKEVPYKPEEILVIITYFKGIHILMGKLLKVI